MKFKRKFPAAWVIALGITAPVVGNTGISSAASTHTTAGVPHLTGGIGVEERTELERRAGAFNFRLIFAEANGAFVIPETVIVRRGNDEVLNAVEDGPLIYMSVPAGVYRVQASYNGVERMRTVQISGNTPNIVMTWSVDQRRFAAD